MNADEIARILDELGSRLGPAGQYAFSLAIRQVYIDVAVNAVLVVIGLALLAAFLPRLFRYGRDGGAYSMNDMNALLIGAVLVIPVALVCVLFVTESIPKFLNPEYAAIRALLRAIN